jgi:8-oxo-dGTP pyrophosphatase MutT (NUDIX family)/phosphohistidine phosphatase SixA
VTEPVRAAGGVVVARGCEGEPDLLLVHRPRYDDWTFPKGKNEPGEPDEDCALREVAEETGIVCALGDELGITQYEDGRGRPKTVRYFAMRPLAGAFRPHNEVDEIAWLAPEAARERLTYDRDRPFVGLAPAPRPPLAFVRHASAGHRESWPGEDDTLRPLDPRGRAQAAGLVHQLEATQVDRIVSSPAVRCTQSVAPLAAARGLEIEVREELAEGVSEADELALVYELEGTGAVLCTHGDVLELLLGEMGEKGSTRIVDVETNGLRVQLSLPPPA